MHLRDDLKVHLKVHLRGDSVHLENDLRGELTPVHTLYNKVINGKYAKQSDITIYII